MTAGDNSAALSAYRRDMNPTTASVLVGTLVLVAVLIGLVSRVGRKRRSRVQTVSAHEFGVRRLAPTATVVQFSTEFCSRCPAVRRSLSDLAARHDDVTFADVDLTHRLDVARRFDVLQTPTVLVVDAKGTVTARFTGAVTERVVAGEIHALRKAADVAVA